MKVDLEKLICSLLKQADKTRYKLRMSNFIEALKEQGLEYKNGKLTQIESEPKFKVGQTIIYKGTENIAPTKMTISDIAKGQYWDDNCCIVPISDQDNWELVEQKPDDKVERKGMNLVEEDMTPFQKKVFCIIDTTIEEEQGLKQVCDELLRLASNEIKQSPAEWSEEDESMLQNILECLKNGWRKLPTDILKYESWLKSIRHHSQWKPSDEQMKALDDVISSRDIRYDVLSELWKDLNKLK